MKTLRIIQELRAIDPEMAIQTAYIFLMVAQVPSIYQRELATRVDLTSSSLSRAISTLDKWSWLKKPGLHLVSSEVDLMDRRQRIIKLTKKGQDLYRKLMQIENDKPLGN